MSAAPDNGADVPPEARIHGAMVETFSLPNAQRSAVPRIRCGEVNVGESISALQKVGGIANHLSVTPSSKKTSSWEKGVVKKEEPDSRSENSQEPLVSISMITYRQEAYIEEAILSVLNQETDFRFELIVSNDNSPDGTDAIIRSILATHSKAECVTYLRRECTLGMMANGLDNLQRCRGEFIAICEGDDAWINTAKLQKQVRAMQENPSCDLSFHPSQIFYGKRASHLLFGFQSAKITTFSLQELILGGCDFCPTAAVILRRSVLENLPDFYLESPVGDYLLKVLGSVRGGALYLPYPFALYRRNLNASWTANTQSLKNRTRFFEQFTTCLSRLDRELGGACKFEFQYEIQRQYRDLAYNCLKNAEPLVYQRAFKALEQALCGGFLLRAQYLLGKLTHSPKLFHLFERIFLERPALPLRVARKWAAARFGKNTLSRPDFTISETSTLEGNRS